MTNIKISQLPAATNPVASTSLVPVVQSGQTVKATLAQISGMVSPAAYGAVGDGVTDDTAAIAACIAAEKAIDWQGLTYKITAPITQTVTKDVMWYGNGASIVYSPSAHSEYAIRLTNAGVVDYLINDISISGSKLCNKVFEILSTGNLITPASNFVANNLFVSEAKRLNTFDGGNGIFIRGAFDLVRFNGGGARDCELPAGQGTPGSAGISGIGITWYSTASYVRRVVISGITIIKVYSSDLAYTSDQDGLTYFVPDESVGGNKTRSQFWCGDGSIFANCYGRSIKTQCLETIVDNCQFTKTEGLTAGGNVEVDAQTGGLKITGCLFKYTGGNGPGVAVNCSSDSNYGNPSVYVVNNRVFLDSSTTLETFAQTFPRDGYFGAIDVCANNVYGKVKQFCNFYCNGNDNHMVVSNNYIKEIVDGVTAAKGLAYFRAYSISPYFAYMTANDNVYDNTHAPSLKITSIPGVGMSAEVSGTNNLGFDSSLVVVTTATANEVTTSGDIDLVLSTKRGTDSGTITIEDGADQDIVIEPDGDGQTTVLGKFLTIGSSPAAAVDKVRLSGLLNSDSATSYGFRNSGIVPAATTSAAYYNIASSTTENAAFALGTLGYYFAQQGTITGGSRLGVTNQYGFWADSSLTGATTNYGFYSNLADASGRWNFFANGTAPNLFRGTTVVGSAALATTATTGFLYVPSCAGTPTGTPTSYGSSLPIVIDSTNHKLYFYSGGTWRDAGP